MRITEDKNWYAIHARPNCESGAEAQVRSLGIETLLPHTRRRIRHAMRTPRIVMRPLFSGYFFARFCSQTSWRAVNYSRGVVRVLGSGDQPWPVDKAIIASIRERIGPDGCVELREPQFASGDMVRINAGPLRSWSGIFDRQLNDAQRVVILIETLQQGRVVVNRNCLELCNAT